MRHGITKNKPSTFQSWEWCWVTHASLSSTNDSVNYLFYFQQQFVMWGFHTKMWFQPCIQKSPPRAFASSRSGTRFVIVLCHPHSHAASFAMGTSSFGKTASTDRINTVFGQIRLLSLLGYHRGGQYTGEDFYVFTCLPLVINWSCFNVISTL